ncbi:unnamed protein product, partial [Ectocarpus sp. 8 AP-2014]
SCRHITTLNLWKTYVEDERLPQPQFSVETVIAQHLPGVRHLALEVDASNRGLRVLLEGCTRLKSLHIGSRSNQAGDSISMYPNDLGMKAFTAVGAPYLETLTLVDKVNIGAAGLRCLLDPSVCPRLRTLTLVRTGRVNDLCLKAIAPAMGRLTSLTLDQCLVKPSTVQFILDKCPELTSIVVSTQHGLLQQPQVGPSKLSKMEVQRLSARGSVLGNVPHWLVRDPGLCATVLDWNNPRIVLVPAETADERIAPFMAGRDP